MTVYNMLVYCTVALNPLLFTNEINTIRRGWNWGENDGWRMVAPRGLAWSGAARDGGGREKGGCWVP